MKIVIGVLVVVSLLLGGALLKRHQKAVEQHEADETVILLHSNQWVEASAKYDEQRKANIALRTNLDQRVEELTSYSNKLVDVSDTLARTAAEKKAALEEIIKRDEKITSLESQRDDMTKKMTDLNSSITTLEAQIAATEKKLTASEGDRAFLLKELQRLQAEKAELERRFNDLAILREQVRKLRDELSIARRLDWIRRGLYGVTGKGGAELLQRGPSTNGPQTNYDLNVELKRDGSVKVNPPPTAPAPTAAPPPK